MLDYSHMTVTILSAVALLFVFIIVLGIWGVYSFVSLKHSMYDSTSKTKAIDIFLYAGIAISLVASVTNVLNVLFEAINRKFIDVLNYSYFMDTTASDVRFAIASLLVMFPVYALLSWYVGKEIVKFPYKGDLLVRKIMIYITLFISLFTLAGTLVSVIYTFLGGELSPRFWYKALAVILVAISLFGYYFYSLKRDYAKKSFVPLIIALTASLFVVGSVTWSISVIGTPKEMRAKRFDSTRLSDLSRLQQEIVNRFQMTDKLPTEVIELNNAFQGYTVPFDPITKVAYEYTVIQQPVIKLNYTTNKKEMTGQGIFELCATFETVREFNERGVEIGEVKGGGMTDSLYSVQNYYYEGDRSPFWNHGAERTCFKRIITPDMYYGR